MNNVNMNVGQTVIATANPNGTLQDGSIPVWSTPDSPPLVTITPAADGLTASIVATAVGVANINVDGVSSFAAGEVHGSGTCTISAAPVPPATAFDVTFGTPS